MPNDVRCGCGVVEEAIRGASMSSLVEIWHFCPNFEWQIAGGNAILGTIASFGQKNKRANTHNNQPRGANEVPRAGGPAGTTDRDHLGSSIDDN